MKAYFLVRTNKYFSNQSLGGISELRTIKLQSDWLFVYQGFRNFTHLNMEKLYHRAIVCRI